MTKKEVIDFINQCDNDSDAPYGFFICAISREDLAFHCDNQVVSEFDKLNTNQKEKVLSNIADEIHNTFEEYEFKNDLENIEIDIKGMIN